ncbi:hypothetical protein FHR22_002620 [Sphingopyxis panaciterrae]|uniref:hypothetical protein n=1 Tax=Sphingopyxis panaciterrae TaxID=363841 RepID=UPI00141DE6D4|nr:hypothetical protein [Sphingopyxis panaciterrae]NIJ37917.1 hypothetical protein [Sphingopyxis panaciterrae]
MTASAKKTFGGELWAAEVGDPLVKVAESLSIALPVMTRAATNVTTHDGGQAQEFSPEGTYDPGELNLTGHYIAGSTDDDLFMLSVTTGALLEFKGVAKAASGTEDLEGVAFVTSYGPNAFEVNGVQMFSVTLKVTGEVDQSPTPTPTPTP